MRPSVFLFDIDGTLVTTGGAGRRSIERTFERVYDRPDACEQISFGGMTDRAIVRLALEAIGVVPTPSTIDAVLKAYVEVLEDEVARVADEHYRVHPGMLDAIETGARRGVAVGLGTGNILQGAKVKLERVGLFERFAFGGFGSDAEDRTELLGIGAERGARWLGASLEECRVVVIGDTPKDVAAARGIGAECIAVATGGASAEELVAAGAERVFPNLAVDGALAALFED
jgi:phosphoglycolate phosphatase-like HAD superfamily hydrolase